ncbi:hypothetical protein BJ508DRAFT_230111 [Ascobolus immersus RN42]|uniref:Peroxisome assembly protein 12 n=1 Tax=Ascobolus immersus RN42 TaxID=1160509 RepID=A0A3N4I0Q5_ASCIM|nr:hypothetical protein BJ508DRAFT_230111 [Ascobolus immersus RN42]
MEFMSSLTSADPNKPSLFELLSETHLNSLLPATLQHILAVLVHRHPRYLIHILNRFDEVYALCMLVVEGHYLRKYGGGFTENFYGLKRERVLPGDDKLSFLGKPFGEEGATRKTTPLARSERSGALRELRQLKTKDVLGSLLMGVGGNWLECKLERWYENLTIGEGVMSGRRNQNQRPDESAPIGEKASYYTKETFKKVYPTAKFLKHMITLAFNLAYLFDNSPYHSPIHYLLGIRMRRLSDLDYRAFDAAANAAGKSTKNRGPSPGLRHILAHPKLWVKIIIPALLNSLKILLPTGIFFLKFLEWWHASDFARQLSASQNSQVALPPPAEMKAAFMKAMKKKDEEKEKKEGEKGKPEEPKCPVCKKEIVSPTAIQTGYVSCYRCAFEWIQEHGTCPVTGREILGGTEGLRRLMV